MNLNKNSVVFWNCAGGIKSKYDYIVDMIRFHKPSVLFISESELTLNDIDIVKIPDYDLLVAGTIRIKTRLACYIHNSIKYKQLLIRDDLDVIALDINQIRVVGVYKGFKLPPGQTKISNFKAFLDTLSKLTKTDRSVIIGGDFNVDINKRTSNLNDLANWAISAGLVQHVEKNTRRRTVLVQDQGSLRAEESLIDHIYSNIIDLTVTHVPSVSDHDILITSQNFPLPARKKVIVRDWRKYTKESVGKMINESLSQISISDTSDITTDTLKSLLLTTLDKLAPKRVVRVKDQQLISPKVEKLKKKRDRHFKLFKKFGLPTDLKKAEDLSKQLKITIKKEARRIFQCKAKSSDPKKFWQAVGQSLGQHNKGLVEIEHNGNIITDPQTMSDHFSEFFRNKVQGLSKDPVSYIQLAKPANPISFSIDELGQVIKSISNKRSYGPDGIPQNLVRDSFDFLPLGLLNTVNTFASQGLPQDLKKARVLPLLKKGDSRLVTNYRPISNVSSLSKIYERCLLNRLEKDFPGLDGHHQHGFKKRHSTETALLTIQSKISEILDSKQSGLIYTIDLSAAFDLLKPDKFYTLFKDILNSELLFCIIDFLQNRQFVVEVNNAESKVHNLDRGCVQGSVLGPKLFSIYTGGLQTALASLDLEVVSYADDTYVIIRGESPSEVLAKAMESLKIHTDFLADLGMIVNKDKTEIMWLGKDPPCASIDVDGEPCSLVSSIKALGITIDGTLTWDLQAELAIKKGIRLNSMFKFIRKYLTEEQFLKSVTANYYSTIFYSSSVWLPNIKAIHKTKLNSLHFRLLRTACKDYNFQISRDALTARCKRATPTEWANYTTASIAMKVVRDKTPHVLHDILSKTYYEERRASGKGRFFDASKTKKGSQSLQNRLLHVAELTEPWNEPGCSISNNTIRRILKTAYFSYSAPVAVTGITTRKRKFEDVDS